MQLNSTEIADLIKQRIQQFKVVTEARDEGTIVSVSMGRDPNSISKESTLKLGELGLLGEYLDDLPYKSKLQELDEDTWSSMGPDEQNQTVEDLENKLRYYQQCNDDATRWVKLNKDEDSSEAVYPIPLEVLP